MAAAIDVRVPAVTPGGMSPVAADIAGTRAAMSEQERLLREQNEMRRNSKDTESSDDGKDVESTDDMDGESEIGGELEASATVTRADYEQRLDDRKARKGLNNYQAALTGR
ncbi:hypothetical protein AYO20_10739 [Fonsecaea nubica]|uniref:Uncharacterized protein n=1 Tax=Fonsecaea nubica TaxID=856822 RepID=A0A178C3F6_9EURO|nr:hypothetical protein AYO20_10739 [Fonsecaea nubica]OAL24127.1 hypothetical protein AYO20_10739 [Fonsecaea nubica]